MLGNQKRPSASLRPQPTRQPSARSRRTKKCYNCQKYIIAEKYNEHSENCFRYKESEKETIMHSQNKNFKRATSKNKIINTNVTRTPQPKIQSKSFTKNASLFTQKSKGAHDQRLNKPRVPNSTNLAQKKNMISHHPMINPNIANRKYHKKQEIQQKKKEQEPEHQTEKYREVYNPEDYHISEEMWHNQEKTRKQYQNGRQMRLRSRARGKERDMHEEQKIEIDHLQAIPLNGTGTRKIRILASQQSEYDSEQLISEDNNFNYQERMSHINADEEDKKRIKQQVLMEIQRQRKKDYENQQHEKARRQEELERQRRRQQEIEAQRERERKRIEEDERRIQAQRQRHRQFEAERQRQLERERQRQRQRQRQRRQLQQRQRNRVFQSSSQQQQNEYPPRNNQQGNNQGTSENSEQINQIIQNTLSIVEFVENLSINDPALDVMVEQLRQLNRLLNQIRELSNLGNTLGFRMGGIFLQRIQHTQVVIINQIGAILMNSVQQEIHQNFTIFLSSRVQNLQLKKGFTEQQIKKYFGEKPSVSASECSICLQDIEKGQSQIQLNCKHSFHPSCIEAWLLQSNKCPMCRSQQKITN